MSWWKNEHARKFHVGCAQLWLNLRSTCFLFCLHKHTDWLQMTMLSFPTLLYISNFYVYPRCCFINMVTPWSYSCCESKNIHVSFVLWALCWFNPDNDNQNLPFILNVIIAYISNVTLYTSVQMLLYRDYFPTLCCCWFHLNI